MSPFLKYVIGLIIAILLGLAVNSWWQHRKQTDDTIASERISVAKAADSAAIMRLDSLGRRVDTAATAVTKVIDHWHVVTQKVQLPGRVDSVFKDSAFAALPDSLKIEVLRLVGEKAAKTCRDATDLCLRYKDSSRVAFMRKDALISLWTQRYENKPRRSCGLGITLGVGGGVDAGFRPHPIIGAMAGYTCNF